jgi:hypothetical protein
MALARIVLKPGVDKQNTEYGAEGGWIDTDYVRFRYGLPEKIGGWTQFNGTAAYLVGMISEIYTWNGLDGAPYMIVGTNRKLYALYGSLYGDITPIRRSAVGVTFDTVNASATVTVNDTTHGCIAGDFVTFSNVTGNPGGITNASLTGEFEVQFITNNNEYTIISPAAATSTVSAAGTADAAYQINTGSDVGTSDYGWGVGTWNLSTWGTPRPASASIALDSRVWQFDNFGEDVICQLVDGAIYLFDTSLGVNVRATAISGAPTKSTYALVSTPDRHLVCFGTESTIGTPSTQDPMFVRFSNQEDINSFVESAINTAGGQRLTDGNYIVSADRSRGQILIWTDTALHGMQYIGPPYTFGFQQLGSNCGLIAPHASADVNGVAYWMSKDAFFMFDGTAKKLACTVQDYVFKDINIVQSEKVNIGVNTQFNEVTWWYCSAASNYIDRFVTFNYLEGVWSIGTMARTAWADLGTYPRPTAAEYFPDSTEATTTTIYGLTAGRSLIYNQEDGKNGNGAAITALVKSGYFDIGDGDQMLFMKRFIPDFKNQEGNLTVHLLLRPYPQATASPSSLDPYIIAPNTEKVDTRARGRQISLRIESNEVDTNWRYGTLRVDIQPDGLR